VNRRVAALLALGLLPPLLLAAVAVAMHAAGLSGVDAAAHAYKIDQLRHGLGAVFWDSFWYGGSYSAIDYGPVYYLCALVVPGIVLVVLAAGSLPLLTYLYLRRAYDVTSYLPAAALTVVLCLYLSNGQDPFLFGLALMMGALVLLAYRRPAPAALAAGLALFSNPLALVVGGVFLIADFIARRELRRPYLVFLAWLTPFLVARGALTVLFSERAAYLDDFDQIVRPLAFALAGAALSWFSGKRRRRHFVTLFFTYAAVCVLALAVRPLPLGNNVNRLFMVFGVPLLLAAVPWAAVRQRLPGVHRAETGRRQPAARRVPLLLGAALVVVAGLAAWQQLATPAGHMFFPPSPQAADAAFFAPALQWAGAHADAQHRLHVVALNKHWEAFYFPQAGYAITRGWYRQEDAIHNALFLPPDYGEGSYVAWLRSMGVRYVLLPHAPLDFTSKGEPPILAGSPAFAVAAQLPGWTVYELRRPGPLFAPLTGTTGGARVLSLGHRSVRLRVDRPGAYVVKVSWSPFWRLRAGAGRLSRGAGDWIQLRADAAGTFTLQFQV
jgi:hypothetical protein